MGDKISKGWEFWLGATLVAAAISVIAAAFFVPDLREIVAKLGAATAAIAVVGASLIAYEGATSKVRYDHQVEKRRKQAARLHLEAKFKFVTSQIILEAREVKKRLQAARVSKAYSETRVTPRDFEITEPSDVTELWNLLDQLPKAVVNPFGVIRLKFAQYSRLLAAYAEVSRIPDIHGDIDRRRRESDLIEVIDQIVEAANKARVSFDEKTDTTTH